MKGRSDSAREKPVDVSSGSRIQDLLDALSGSSWYSSLDLASGYWQVEVENADKLKTAFTTPYGVYLFHVMPFGLTNAPATFQRLMDYLFQDLKPTKCFFGQRELKFLGHVVGKQGVATDPAKIEAVENFPIPRNLRQLRGFLGLASPTFLNLLSSSLTLLTSLSERKRMSCRSMGRGIFPALPSWSLVLTIYGPFSFKISF